MKKFCVVGGGISGLLVAYLLKKKNSLDEVYLVEKENEFGGLLRSFDYGVGEGLFDYGIHTIYESGVDDLDQLIRSFLRLEDWIQLKGKKRDFGGTYFNNVLQVNSAYIDLRNFSKEDVGSFIDSYLNNLNNQDSNDVSNAKEYLEVKFGKLITEKVFEQVISKLYNFPLRDAHSFFSKLLPLERIVLFGEDTMSEISNSSVIRNSIAFPDQMTMPDRYVADKSAWYPKEYGMKNYIEAFISKLKEMGVILLNSHQIKSVVKQSNSKIALEIGNIDRTFKIEDVEKIIWTSGIVPCYFTLFKNTSKPIEFDKPVQTCFVNFILKNEPKVDGMYYVYCLEPGFITHRLSCPSNFCPSSIIEGQHKLTAEVVFHEKLTEEEIIKKVTAEIEKMGIISASEILFKDVKIVSGGYPTISNKNVKAMEIMKDEINNQFGENIDLYGYMSKPNLFFQVDIIREIYNDFK